MPFIGVKLEPLADVPVVRDLEALVRALESPLDRVAWLAVLRAPFVGLSLADLTVVSETAGDSTDPVGADRRTSTGCRPTAWNGCCAPSRCCWRRGSSANANRARTWSSASGSRSAARPPARGARTRPRAPLPAALDEEDRKRLRGRQLDLERLMDRLYAEDPAQPDAVSLMTIHGAKGLEFDHVFVVGVGLRGRGDDPRLLNWLEIAARAGRRSPGDGAHPRVAATTRTTRTTPSTSI